VNARHTLGYTDVLLTTPVSLGAPFKRTYLVHSELRGEWKIAEQMNRFCFSTINSTLHTL
jgi:hypothetical protein